MTDPYVGEIRLFGGNYAPEGWELCNGQTLAIANYETLFAVIGTTYGGDGNTTFALPQLQNILAIGTGQGPGLQNYVLGQQGGQYAVTLTAATMPAHSHPLLAATGNSTSLEPMNNLFAATDSSYVSYLDSSKTGATVQAAAPSMLTNNGTGQAHANMMPTLGVSYIIATNGIFPSSN